MKLLVVAIVFVEFGPACAASARGMCHESGYVSPVLHLHVHTFSNLRCPQTRVTELRLACRSTHARNSRWRHILCQSPIPSAMPSVLRTSSSGTQLSSELHVVDHTQTAMPHTFVGMVSCFGIWFINNYRLALHNWSNKDCEFTH